MNIREINKNDISALTEIIMNYKLEHNSSLSNDLRKEIIRTLLTLVDQKEIKTLIAINNMERIIGFINYHEIIFPMIAGKEIYISDLIVDKKERGKGIGKKLIAEIYKMAKNKKFKRLMLNNSKISECYYNGFYKNLGFDERGKYSNFIKYIDKK